MRFVLILFVSLNAFAAGREIAPRETGPSSYYSKAQTAFAGNRFLTVWVESRGEIGHPLMGMLSDANGRRISSRAFAILSDAGSSMRLIGMDNSFAFFRHAGGRWLFSNIDVQGNVTRTTVVDLQNPDWNTQAVWNGKRLLIAISTVGADGNFRWSGCILDRTGAAVRSEFLFLPGSATLSPSADGFVVVTTGRAGIHAQRITNEGDIARTDLVVAAPDPRTGRYFPSPALAAPTAEQGTLVVWGVGASAFWEVQATVVRADGTVMPAQVLAGLEAYPALVHLARGMGMYVLTLVMRAPQEQLMTLVLRSDGSLQSPVRAIAAVFDPVVDAASSGETTMTIFRDLAARLRPLSIPVASNGIPTRPPEEVTIGSARPMQPVLATAGSRLLAMWSELTSDAQVRTASLNLNGDLLSHRTIASGKLASRDLPWNESESLLLMTREGTEKSTLLASRIDMDGNALGEPIRVGETKRDSVAGASATWAVDRWLVAWVNAAYQRLSFSVIRNDAVELTRAIIPKTQVPRNRLRTFTHVAIARNAKTTLLVWTEDHLENCGTFPPEPCGDSQFRTYAARVTPEGDFIDADVLEVPTGAHSVSVATSGDEFIVLTDGTATVIDADARRVKRSTTLFNWNAASDVTWTGSTYAVALRYHTTRWYLAVAHLDREARLIGELRGIETLPADTLAPPSVAGGIVALQEGDAMGGARAVVYDEAPLAPLPPAPPHPIAHVEPVDRFYAEVTWDPVPFGELYTVELSDDGQSWWLSDTILADQPLKVRTVRSDIIRVTAVGAGGASSPPPRRRSARP